MDSKELYQENARIWFQRMRIQYLWECSRRLWTLDGYWVWIVRRQAPLTSPGRHHSLHFHLLFHFFDAGYSGNRISIRLVQKWCRCYLCCIRDPVVCDPQRTWLIGLWNSRPLPAALIFRFHSRSSTEKCQTGCLLPFFLLFYSIKNSLPHTCPFRKVRNSWFSYRKMKADGVMKSVFETSAILPVLTSLICRLLASCFTRSFS